MNKFFTLLLLGTLFSITGLRGQAVLPDFTVENNKGNVIVLWLNQYPKPVIGISVQSAYDSAGDFTSIGSVFNPQNIVNGFTDFKPSYDQMYYRLFIGFDTGVYILTAAKQPEIKSKIDYSELILEINALYEKNIVLHEEKMRVQEAANRALAAKKAKLQPKTMPKVVKATKPKTIESVSQNIINEVITYPSKRIFTNKDGNVIIKLANIKESNYSVKFLTEDGKPLFDVNILPDDYTTLEKVNFKHSGWFTFEIYKNGVLFEENKFYIPKDMKK